MIEQQIYYDGKKRTERLEALEDADLEDPTNPNVEASIKSGLPVTKLDPRSPLDIQKYFKNIGNLCCIALNKYNTGTSLSTSHTY